MSAVVINLNAIRTAMDKLREETPWTPLHYWATPNEYKNKAWREWFAKNYPSVILHMREDVPRG